MRNKFICLIGSLFIATLIIAGCEKGPAYRTFTYPVPVASGMSPVTGYPGSNVTITGSNFDTLTGAVKVWFGGIPATTVVSSSNNQIVVQVPATATSGKVSLQVWTNKLDSIGTFTVTPRN
ncbi:MAG: IPT/TIG domain-containing protein [Niabella sp.]|nr:IPT/TIG domain-containing protein [Niabella sp.]